MSVSRWCVTLLAFAKLFTASTAQSCISQISDIYDQERSILDTSVHRKYILCPGVTFRVGDLDFDLDLKKANLQPPLPIRSNMTIFCGDLGDRNDLCLIDKGHVQIDATPFRGITDETAENVLIQGVTFSRATKYALWASKPGDITFRDCEFREFSKSIAPIMMDWFDGTDSLLNVIFEDCLFHHNRYAGSGSNTALIYGNSAQTSLTVIRTTFDNNDLVFNNTMSTTNSFIIESLGPVTLERTCFRNNTVGVSNVAVFGNGLVDFSNYVENSAGDLCEFASVFENLQQFDQFTPFCVNALELSCAAFETNEPTINPTDNPSIPPTIAPSSVPTGAPTPIASSSPTVNTTSAAFTCRSQSILTAALSFGALAMMD